MSTSFYTGAPVSSAFMSRWRSKHHVGSAAPWCEVKIRRGRLERSYHYNWQGRQFGRIFGQPERRQWYPDWTPIDDWQVLDGVASIDLDQSFDKNGSTVATLEVENVAWQEVSGHDGMIYHTRQRGYLWPWRGWTPAHRPGSGERKNEWYNRLPNAQILIRQGYGEDSAVKTFTGLIDTYNAHLRPDRMTITSRDFGSVLADCHIFGWNIDKALKDPITFLPPDHKYLKLARAGGQSWVIVQDATDVVRVILRWAGFKEWEIEDSGVKLIAPYTVDKSKTYMDVINDIKEQLGYVFFIGEPSGDDRSIGVPVFRRASVLIPSRSKPIALRDQDLLTDLQPQHDNASDRAIIRVRGVVDKQIGRTLSGDTTKRVTFQYWPPWLKTVSGVIKQLTYYDVGDKGSLGFRTLQECIVACVLLAVQIALLRDTATAQCPGQPAFGLDSFAYVTDAGTGVASRLYVASRKSTMRRGGDGTGPLGTGGELIWATELGGSLCDNPEVEHIIRDYNLAIAGQNVMSWSPEGWT